MTKRISSQILVIDVNHRWSSENINDNTIIIQPNSRYELIEIIREIPNYINPRLSLVIITDLPLYFRDYYGRDRLQTQNMRAYGACLALLHRVSREFPILYTTYPNGLNPDEPIMYNHSYYYSDYIYQGINNQNGAVEFIDIETGEIVSRTRVYS